MNTVDNLASAGIFFWPKKARKEKMEKTITVKRGSDWCNVQISPICFGGYGGPDQCWLLGDQIRICELCVQEMHKIDSPEDFVWALTGPRHKGICDEVPVSVGFEKVIICPPCIHKVLDELARACECSCHELGGVCEGRPFCVKCGAITRIDVIYMTRQQTERHPK